MFKTKNDKICRGCPYVTHPFVPGSGNPKAKLLLLGRDPGEEEEDQGIPFVGQSGGVLNATLEELKVDRDEDAYVTNIVKCRPPGNDAKTPEWKQAAQQCRKYLDYELKKVKPNCVLAFGNEAVQAVTSLRGGITKHRGKVVEIEDAPYKKVVPIFHPSYVLRKYTDVVVQQFVNDVQRGVDESKSTEVSMTKESGFKYKVIRDMKQFKVFAKKLLTAKRIVFDVETDGLAWFTPLDKEQKPVKVICCAFCLDGETGYTVPFRTFRTKTVTEHYETKTGKKRKRKKKLPVVKSYWKQAEFKFILQVINKAFNRKGVWLCGHNVKFDMHHMANNGIQFPHERIDDTKVMASLCDERSPSDLKTLVSTYVPSMAGYEQEIREQDDFAYKLVSVDPEILYKYNAGDVVGTWRVREALIPLMKQEGVADYYKNVSRPVMHLLFEMERLGFPVAIKSFKKVAKEITEIRTDLTKELWRINGSKFDPRKNKQLIQIMFKDRNLPPVLVSEKTGEPSTSAECLQIIEEQTGDEFVSALRKWRKWQKWYSTYIKGFLKRLSKDWTIHCRFNQHVAATGRLSSSNPNMQQIPREGPIKWMFEAPPGWKIISADLSQAELRVAAKMAGDKNMLKAFESGADPHQEVAYMIFHKPKDQVTKDERSIAKTVNFGVLFGKGEEAAAADCGCDVDEMKGHFAAYWKKFFKLKEFTVQTPKFALKHGYVRAPLGRKRRFDVAMARSTRGGVGQISRQSVNFKPQSTASDCNCLAAVRSQRKFKKLGMRARMIGLVHDQQLALVPDDEVVRAMKILHSEMESPIEVLGGLKIPSEIGVGQSWAQADLASSGLKEAIKSFKTKAYLKVERENKSVDDYKVRSRYRSRKAREAGY